GKQKPPPQKCIRPAPFSPPPPPAHLARLFLAACIGRQPHRHRLEADWLRRPPRLQSAVRVLRSRLSRLRRRPAEKPMTTQTYRDSDTVDFVIVGSGAAGGGIARGLAQAGLAVGVVGQGPRVSPRRLRADELGVWYLGGITTDAFKHPQTFRDDALKQGELQKFKPALWYGRGVGGGSLHYTANFWRFHEIDFIERSVLGAIPGTGFADWPIAYADLEPYY